jgi:tRNA threonylcarbamoyladenosine biosynthesis protein TsaB
MANKARDQIFAIALETSGRLGSVTLSRGPRLLETTVLSAEKRHAVELLPAVDSLCKRHNVRPSQLDEVYASAGPGSFTGLRVGMTVARTLAWAARAGVVRVPTLDVIAENALEAAEPPRHLAVLLDAKRSRVYAAAFVLAGDHYRRLTEPAEVDVEEFAATLPGGCVGLGEGIPYHQAAVNRAGLPVLPEALNRARAEVVSRLGFARASAGHFDGPGELVPIYVRRPEAEEVWERRQGRGDSSG